MSNIIDKIQVSGVTYDIGGSGGGKAIEGGRGISVTTGETVDTVSISLPISAGTGNYSIQEGQGAKASGNTSHAEGYNTIASGNTSHAEGSMTKANGEACHAEGVSTRANGEACHAEGIYTQAIGNYSHAEGLSTKANGIYSHTEGRNTNAINESEHASGQYNNSVSASTTFGDSGNTLFSVGNGTSSSARHNAFEIRQNGDIYLSSGGTDIKLQDHLGGGGGGGNPTVELTQAEYDALVTAGTVAEDTFYVITDAQAGDLTQYWTSAQTQSAITQATSGLQETLVSGTNIKTINNQSLLGSGNIDIQGGGGGGKAIEAGRGISVTTGETADTVSFNLPISANTNNSVVMGGKMNSSFTNNGRDCLMVGSYLTTKNGSDGSLVVGYNCSVNGDGSAVIGWNSSSTGDSAFAFGAAVTAKTHYTFAAGRFSIANNMYETSFGQYNESNTGSTNADKTLFSVGNGTANNARHNAFEIRQNGDIYLSSGGTDIKLQDHLGGGGGGGGITIDPTLDSGSTNAVANSAITTAIDSKQNVLNTGYYGGVSSSYMSSGENIWDYANLKKFVNSGNAVTENGGDRIYFTRINGKKLVSGFIPTAIPLPNLSLVETSAITTSVTSSSTDAQVPSAKAVNDKLGGLSLVKLNQAEYDSLVTKDNSTLYVIVN